MERIRNLLILLVFVTLCKAQEFNPLHPDYGLLNQLVLEKINSSRAAKHADALEFNETLNEVATFYTDTYVLRKFENNEKNKIRINKKLKKLLKSKGFHPKLTTYCINTNIAINYRKQDYYFDAEEPKSDLHLYLGKKKPSRKMKTEESYDAKPIENFTYDHLASILAKKILGDSKRLKSANKAYSMAGFSCVVDPRSLRGKNIPKLKYIFILGGKIISW